MPTSPLCYYRGCSLPTLYYFSAHVNKFMCLVSFQQTCLFTDFPAHPRTAVCWKEPYRLYNSLYWPLSNSVVLCPNEWLTWTCPVTLSAFWGSLFHCWITLVIKTKSSFLNWTILSCLSLLGLVHTPSTLTNVYFFLYDHGDLLQFLSLTSIKLGQSRNLWGLMI